jgi:hypothetical protein
MGWCSMIRYSKIFYLFLKSSGLILVIIAAGVFFIGLLSLISGDGFTDAAPWWVFLFMAAAVLGLPGIILLLAARYISKKINPEKK